MTTAFDEIAKAGSTEHVAGGCGSVIPKHLQHLVRWCCLDLSSTARFLAADRLGDVEQRDLRGIDR